LVEATIGLFKTEAIGRGNPFLSGPLRTIDDVEYTTMQWDTARNCRPNSVAAHGVTVQNMRETGRIRWLIDG
jgi:putative transposase